MALTIDLTDQQVDWGRLRIEETRGWAFARVAEVKRAAFSAAAVVVGPSVLIGPPPTARADVAEDAEERP